MRTWVLGSGSRGNAVLLESDGGRVLIDAGFPARVIADRLAQIRVAPESISHVVITHEHHDHARGAAGCARAFGWEVIATRGTIRACPELSGGGVALRGMSAGETLALEHFEIATARTPHDATESMAVRVTARSSGVCVGIANDLGCATDAVRRLLRDLDVLVLEANHDEGMLRAGPYPPSVRDRIAGRGGHLSNRAAAVLAAECVTVTTRHVVLAHLSERCNDQDIAARAVRTLLSRTRFAGLVHVSEQDALCGPFALERSARRRPNAIQLALPFDEACPAARLATQG